MIDHDLDIILNYIITKFPETGYKRMIGFLKAMGIVVQPNRVPDGMRRINPQGTLLRPLRLHAINRRSYLPSGIENDGNHKLIM